ncbi:hypothetical protein [uncultured Enterococcus sp.]|uniref:hypothetical protein n=1 Tax=uncultured Enterococcus sp. TaxID=167972 RepID=UPI002AA84A00|nr:hypothetical protein [uncultured Enterococcus sp.]
MNIWQVLAIDPTSDIKKIKQAYAAKLKTLTIDQQLDEFQELKTAFDTALAYARSGAVEPTPPTHESLVPTKEQPIAFDEAFDSDTAYSDWNELKVFSIELKKIQQGQAYFDDLSLWEDLTEQIFDWGIEEYWENQYLIQLFLLNNFRWLSRQVINYLIALFDLENLDVQTTQPKYVSHEFLHYLPTIEQAPPFSFDIWTDIPQHAREQYFASRYRAYQLLTSSHIYAGDPFSQSIDECFAVTRKDTDIYALLLLKLLTDKNDAALSDSEQQQVKDWLNEAASLDKNNQTILFLQDYYALVIEKSEQPPSQKSEWTTEQLLVPKPLFYQLYEEMLFQQKHYTDAFTVWKRLSRDERLSRLKRYNNIRRQLPDIERQELQQLNRHLNTQTEQYKNKQAAQNNMIRNIFIAAIAGLAIFSFIGGLTNTSKKPTKVDMKTIQQQIQSNSDFSKNSLLESARATLKKTEAARTLMQALYSEDEVNVEDLFATEALSAEFDTRKANAQLNYDSNDFSYYSQLDGQEMLRYISIYHQDNFLYVITVDETNYTITAVYGDDWTQLPEEELQGLIDFTHVKKSDILVLFLKEYLFAEDRAAALENYGVYFSPTLRMTMERNIKLPIPEKFRNGWLYQVYMDYNEIVYVLTNEQEDFLYFAFDEENRLHCIYGEHWISEEIPTLEAYGETVPMADILNSY